MKARKQAAQHRIDSLEQTLIDIWHEAQECDGSRAAQQTCLDAIQEMVEVEMPDVHEYLPSKSRDDEDDDSDESEDSDDTPSGDDDSDDED